MKTLNILLLIMGSLGFGFAQTNTPSSKSDSVRVELERKSLSVQQIQLRDSINRSIELFSKKIDQTPASKRKKLEQARKDLVLNKEILQRDIDEVGLTARNSWTNENVKRLHINVAQVRREHVRIRAELKN